MVYHFDKEYLISKQFKKGEGTLKPPLDEILNWIKLNYDIKPITLFFNRIIHNKRPYLEIILDQYFKIENSQDIENEISKKFISIAKEYSMVKGRTRFLDKDTNESNIENLIVRFGYFIKIAMSEAVTNIPKDEIEELKKYLKIFNIYEILSYSSHTTFFFDTNQNFLLSIENGSRESIIEEYFKLVKRQDKFNCIKYEYLLNEIRFESKEKFDNMNSSIYYFYR